METEKLGVKKYIFVYQTKNLINEKTYIGVHSTNKLNDGYIGCGIKSDTSARSQIKAGRKYPFILAVSKYGYSNFKREILSFYDTQEEAYEEEYFLLNEKTVRCNETYNASIGGKNSSKIPMLYDYREEINKMYKEGLSYREISEKFKVSKGAWIHLLNYESKREKPSFYNGLKIEHLDGRRYTITTNEKLKTDIGINPKNMYKLKKNGVYNNWYISDSERLNNKRKEIDNKFILIRENKIPLIDIYLKGVSVFAKENNINIATLELKIKNSKRGN